MEGVSLLAYVIAVHAGASLMVFTQENQEFSIMCLGPCET